MTCDALLISDKRDNNNNDNTEILIKRKPLVYTRAQRAVQRRKKKLWHVMCTVDDFRQKV